MAGGTRGGAEASVSEQGWKLEAEAWGLEILQRCK
jgi:hypothetical protein